MNPLFQSKNATILPVLIALTLGCVALSPTALAVTPAPDGGYPNGNTAEGQNALFSLTTGFSNTASGFDALYSNTSGSDNTANGASALLSNTNGNDNTANGESALDSNTSGSDNTATGAIALEQNTTGSYNTANGFGALSKNNGASNTATGTVALTSNTIGYYNTATGANALQFNTEGFANTATGTGALYGSTAGNDNTADGFQALGNNTIGSDNTAVGANAMYYASTGSLNTAIGETALELNSRGSSNTAIGHSALLNNTSGGSNIAVGDSAGSLLTTGKNNIDIGSKGVAGESNTIRIGKKGTQTTTVIAGIRGTTVAGGIGVLIDANGRLGTTTSSARFKQNIQLMDRASEAILALQPVTFRYKHDLDPDGIPQFGLVAEQVEKVDPALVARDDQGKPYTVRYEAVNAMLLNEFLKEHRKVEELEATVTQLQAAFKAQAAQVQKVSDQLRAQAPAPRVVAND